MLLHQIEALVEVGVAHVVLAVSYHAEQLEQEMQVTQFLILPNVNTFLDSWTLKKVMMTFFPKYFFMIIFSKKYVTNF